MGRIAETDLLAAIRRLAALAATGVASTELADAMCHESARLLGVEAAALWRYDGDELVNVGGWFAQDEPQLVRGTRFPLEGSMMAVAVRETGRPVHAPAYTTRSGEAPSRIGRLGFDNLIAAPIFVAGHLWGTLTAGSRNADLLPPGTETELEVFAEMSAVVVASTENLARLEAQTAEQDALLRVSRHVLEHPEDPMVLAAVAREAATLLGLSTGAVLSFGANGAAPQVEASWDAEGRPADTVRDDIAEAVRARRAVVSVGDPDSTYRDDGRRALGHPVGWGVPIEIERRLWGALIVAGEPGRPLSHDAGVRLARFAELSGLAIARIEARDALVEQVIETEQFASLVEGCDDFIAIASLEGHCQYVNPGGRRLVGLSSLEEARRHEIRDFLTPEALVASEQVEQPAVREHGSFRGETSLRHFVTGEEIPVSVNSFLFTHPITNEPLGLATVQRDLRERKRADEALERRTAQVEELAAARRFLLVETLRAEERLRRQIGDALHDEVLQELYAARQDLEETPGESEELHRARVSVDAACRQLRETVGDLHPAVTSTRDLQARLRSILQQGGDRAGFGHRLEVVVPGPSESDDVLIAVVRELVQNVVKHAGATFVTVLVEEDGEGIRLRVSDDGRGMPSERPVEALRAGHIGLASARERVEALGGSWSLESAPGAGTCVDVQLPRPQVDGMA